MERTAVRRRLSWQAATVTSLIRETAAVCTIELDPPDWPGHRAGQHLDVRLTAKDGYVAERSYSIASAPGEPLAITVERLDDGEVSPYLTEELRVGDAPELRGPIGGYFVWEHGDGSPLLLLGDDPVLVHRQNLVLWSQMADMSQANIDAKANKGKQPAALPPSVTPPALPAPGGGQGSGDGPAKPDSQQYAPSARGEPTDSQEPPQQAGKAGKGKGGKTGESLAGVQLARYRARLREALAAFTESTTADDVTAQLAKNFPT